MILKMKSLPVKFLTVQNLIWSYSNSSKLVLEMKNRNGIIASISKVNFIVRLRLIYMNRSGSKNPNLKKEYISQE